MGVAIAGFSAIATTLNRRLILEPGSADRAGLLTLLETAGLVVLFALLPQVLQQAPLDEASLWRGALLSYAVLHLVHGGITRIRRTAHTFVPVIRPLLVGGGAVIVGQFLAIVLGSVETEQLVYLVALSWHTVVAAVAFATLILNGGRDAYS